MQRVVEVEPLQEQQREQDQHCQVETAGEIGEGQDQAEIAATEREGPMLATAVWVEVAVVVVVVVVVGAGFVVAMAAPK